MCWEAIFCGNCVVFSFAMITAVRQHHPPHTHTLLMLRCPRACSNCCGNKKRGLENVKAARRRAVPIGELLSRFGSGNLLRRTTPEPTSQVSGNPSLIDEQPDDSDEEEGRGQGLVCVRGERRMTPVATCREHSTSAWLHFPHVELVVLFYAFEGAVASFASAMRHAECPEVFYTAMGAFVSDVPVVDALCLL